MKTTQETKRTGIAGRIRLTGAGLILAFVLALLGIPAPAEGATLDAVSSATTPTLAAPSISSVQSVNYNTLKISWSAVADASSYEVYRATSSTGTYAKVAGVTATQYSNTGLATGKTYYYKVRAVGVYNGTTIKSAFSAVKSGKAIPGTQALAAASASYNSIKLTWNAITGANGYTVYRATSATGAYTAVTSVAATTYTNGSLVTGKYYYYKVRAWHMEGTTKVYGNYAAVKYAKPVPSAPGVAVTTKTMTSARIAWTGVSGAGRYEVYRSTSATGTYTLIYTAPSTARSYINTGLANGSTYYYKVRAAHPESGVWVNGYFSAVKSVKVGAVYEPGVYLVGRDIPAGDFLMIQTKLDSAQVIVSTDALAENWLAMGIPQPSIYFTLQKNEYVTLQYTKAYAMAWAPLVPTNPDGTLSPGQYKVGRDIPAGTYVLYESDSTFFGHVDVRKDALNRFPSILGQDSYSGRIYVTVETGQYLTFRGDIGYPIASAPPLDLGTGVLRDGMYLVGTDIPAGTYTITAQNTLEGYYKVYSDATHKDSAILSQDTLAADRTVTVQNGQYLFVFGGTITVNLTTK